VIDLGPEGGEAGGQVIAAGTPEQVARSAASYTGQYLRPVLARASATAPPRKRRARAAAG
jgi:excinuclease ABC subunit A